MSSTLKDWVMIVLQLVTLVSIVYSAIKVVNRNVMEWSQREQRLSLLESQIIELRRVEKELTSVDAKLLDISQEMTRVRDRLDRFLDSQYNPSPFKKL